MIPADLAEALLPVARAQRIIWLAMTASIAAYVAVVLLVVPAGAGTHAGILPMVFYLIAGMTVVMAVGLRRFLFTDAQIAARLRRITGTGPGPSLGERELRVYRLVVGLNPLMLVVLVLHETVALYGLVLAFLIRSPEAILPFAAVALVLNLLTFPKPERLAERALAMG